MGLLASALVLLSCQGGPAIPVMPTGTTPSELRVGLPSLPSSTDPALTAGYEGAIARVAFEPLLKQRPDLSELDPAAADRYEVSADGLTYTFHLRVKARWSDGTAVRAEDFVSAWRRVLDPRVNSPWGDLLAARIKGAAQYANLDPVQDLARIPTFLDGLGLKASDGQTFVVELAHPAPDFRWIAALPALAPTREGSPAGAGQGAAEKPGARLSNGPFEVRSATTAQVVLAANGHYWGAKPALSRIILVQVPAGEAGNEFRQGRQDLSALTREDAARAGQDPAAAAHLLKVTRLEQSWIQFNVHSAPFDNSHVRLAFAKAIDRESLVAQVLKGVGLPSSGLIPSGLPDHRPNLAAQRFDLAAARDELNLSGLSPAALPQIHLLTRDLPPDRALAEFVAAQVRDHLGLDIVLDVKPSREVTRLLANGRFQVQGPAGWIADYADERDWLDLFLTEHFAQSSRYSSVAYDHLVEQGDGEPNPARRRQAYLQAQQILVEDAPVAFLFQAQSWSLRQPYVRNLKPSALDSWPGDASVAGITVSRH
ncbi:MAG: peptide ABC transporter substrate-binding protein [Candidatus Dormibacteraeota bacterium]|nr:peptide ABC transporter substrate-binding protein [Candidatus Dormibacteraeota bacterium]